MLFCDHAVSLEDFKLLASSNSEFDLKIKESILISRNSQLKRNGVSLTLCQKVVNTAGGGDLFPGGENLRRSDFDDSKNF